MVASATPRMGPYINIYVYIYIYRQKPRWTPNSTKPGMQPGFYFLHTHTFDFSKCPHGYTGLNPSHPLGYNHIHEVEWWATHSCQTHIRSWYTWIMIIVTYIYISIYIYLVLWFIIYILYIYILYSYLYIYKIHIIMYGISAVAHNPIFQRHPRCLEKLFLSLSWKMRWWAS